MPRRMTVPGPLAIRVIHASTSPANTNAAERYTPITIGQGHMAKEFKLKEPIEMKIKINQ